jgi:hypothetical protein
LGIDHLMSVCNDVADYHWLTGEEASVLLQDLASGKVPLHTAVARLRRFVSPQRTHLLIEQAELRRRAAVKFADAERMFFTRTALQQATDEFVARYKGARFTREPAGAPSTARIADLCCGIGGDLLALAEQGSVVAVDCNPVVAHLAAANLNAVHPSADVLVDTADVAQFNRDDVAAWHIDPDRRANGKRTTSLNTCQPNLAVIERLLKRLPHAAVKLAPATKAPDAWAECCELEWISHRGECRQQVVWHGDLAHTPGQHRATILSAASGFAATRSITGKAINQVPLTAKLDQYIFDLDPAVHAAHLQGTLAAEYALSALAHGPTYLTGTAPVFDPAMACFDVDDVLPLRVKSLAAYLRKRGVGQLEIKKRGIDFEVEKLRRELKLPGSNAATLLITPVAGRATVIVAHRVG